MYSVKEYVVDRCDSVQDYLSSTIVFTKIKPTTLYFLFMAMKNKTVK